MHTLPHRSRSRFVTTCQQLLALAVVLAGLTPAIGVVSLDVVGSAPGGAVGQLRTASADVAKVPTEAVRAVVREVELTDTRGRTVRHSARSLAALPADARPGIRTKRSGRTELVSPPAGVTGAGVVGVTWASGAELEESDIVLQVRTRQGTRWSDWTELVYHADEHAPDPDSAEAGRARPGSDEAIVANSDMVQARITTAKGIPVPADLRLAVVAPGAAEGMVRERAALDTAKLPSTEDPADAPEVAPAAPRKAPVDAREEEPSAAPSPEGSEPVEEGDALDLAATAYTAKPQIFSRSQWGADESLRHKGSLTYGKVHAAFAHHTVTANQYSREQVPGIIRSIYAYHTKSRGWSDIGYNFLIDKFGRIWEGRYGGVDRAVVGAHTAGYNSGAFAASALGNYDITRPSDAMVNAYGRLFGWKLSLHGVSAKSAQWVSGRAFGAVSGHRDAGSTACPGRYLYEELPRIRGIASSAQVGWTGRDLKSDLAGTPAPDLVARRASDGKGVLIPVGGQVPSPGKQVPAYDRREVAEVVQGITLVLLSPSLDGDDIPDLVVGSPAAVAIRKGRSDGTFADARPTDSSLLKHHKFAAVGDLNRDGHNDLVAQRTRERVTDVFLGNGQGGFRTMRLYRPAFEYYNRLAGPGDVTGDGRPDLLGRDRSGRLFLHPGAGNGGFGEKVRIGTGYDQYNTIIGFGDHTGDGHNDVFLRREGGDGFVLPGLGDGRFGTRQGPIKGVHWVGALSSGGNVAGTSRPDMVGRLGTDIIMLTSTVTTTSAMVPEPRIVTSMDLRHMTRVMNVGDWDRDGYGDVIARGEGGVLWLFRGTGTATFHTRQAIGKGFHLMNKLAAVGDMTGDGWPDLMAQRGNEPMRIFAGRGRRWLGGGFVAGGRVEGTEQFGVGRWNRDGAPDTLVRQGNRLVFIPGNGPGGMMAGAALGLDLAPYDAVVAVSDVGQKNGGQSDLVARERGTGRLVLLPGNGVGVGAPTPIRKGMNGYDLFG